MGQAPDQAQLWCAYGKAMGSVLGLEMVLQVALTASRHRKLVAAAKTQERLMLKTRRLVRSMNDQLYSQAVHDFLNEHPTVLSDEDASALRSTIKARNRLAHRFLFESLPNLTTDRGVALITAECDFYNGSFNALRNAIYSAFSADVDLFVHSCVTAPRPSQPHPLDDLVPR